MLNPHSNNYRKIAFDHLPHKCSVCGFDKDVRLLEVHHIDEDRQNNYLNNLIILCPTCHRGITLGYYVLNEDNKIYMIDSNGDVLDFSVDWK
jgi:5-methylcytosine-specific restriction endonuclease McrA